jgi:hypothetical protein
MVEVGSKQSGFVSLAGMLIVALSSLALLSAFIVVAAMVSASRDDAGADRARAVAEIGLADAAERVRWGWACPLCADVYQSPDVRLQEGGYRFTIQSRPESDATCLSKRHGAPSAIPAGCERVYGVRVDAWSRGALSSIDATMVAVPDALPRGLVSFGDMIIESDVVVTGCGICSGGDVTGRERIVFKSPGWDSGLPQEWPVPPDLAYGGLYPDAGVHASGCIVADGHEIHEDGGTLLGDTDVHTENGLQTPVCSPPDPPLIAALDAHSVPWPGSGVEGVCLDLRRLPADVTPSGDNGCRPTDGIIVVGPATGLEGSVSIVGSRPAAPGVAPATIVVRGDAVIESASGEAGGLCFEGALVVTGTLTIAVPTDVHGSLAAGRLRVLAPLSVTFGCEPLSPVQEYAPGASNILIAGWSD